MPSGTNIRNLYDPIYDAFPDLERGRIVLAPVRVGMDRTTGKMLVGWNHVEQSIRVIFMTRFHERVLRGWVGSFVPHLLGQSAIERVITRFYWAIASAIDIWEPNYRINRVRVDLRADQINASQLTSADELRKGHLSTKVEGVYRPRGHLGDETPEIRRGLGLVGRNYGVWDRVP